MKFENVFQDICDTLTAEEALMCESLENIYEMSLLNSSFFESTDIEDIFFTEAPDIKGMSSKAKEVVLKAIRFLIEQIKKFGKMIADRVSDFMKKREIKKLIKQAKSDAKKYSTSKIDIRCDPLQIIKLQEEYVKACVKLMDTVKTTYKSGNLTEEKKEDFEKRISKANDKYQTELAKYMDREVTVAYNQAIVIAGKVDDYLENSRDIKIMETKLESIERDMESCGFDFMNPADDSINESTIESSDFDRFLESLNDDTCNEYDNDTYTEDGKVSVAPNKFCAMMSAIADTFRANKGKSVTALLQNFFAIAFGRGAINSVQNGDILGSAINGAVAGGLGNLGIRKTHELSKDVYSRYKNTKIEK